MPGATNLRDCVILETLIKQQSANQRFYVAPVTVAALTETGAVPVEVMVSDCVVGELTVTVPKLSFAALRLNCGFGAGVLVPLREMVVVSPLFESLVSTNWPSMNPAVVAANCTCSVVD